MPIKTIVFVILGLAIALTVTATAAPPSACAHVPVFKDAEWNTPETAKDLAGAESSQIVFGKLKLEEDQHPFAPYSSRPPEAYGHSAQANGDLDVLALHVDEDSVLRLRLLVPKKSGCGDFEPSMLIIGPGLKEKNRTLPYILRGTPSQLLSWPRSKSGKSLTGSAASEGFFDPSTMMGYRIGPSFARILPAGTYHVIVFAPPASGSDIGGKGEYALEIIGENESDVPALLRRPIDVMRIKLGAYR